MRSKVTIPARPVATLLVSLFAPVLIWSDSLAEALQAHRYTDAVALADTLLKTKRDDPRIWTVRGVSLTSLGRDAEALSSFGQALEIDPKFLPALKGAVEVAYRTRDGRAASLVERLLGIDPQNDVAHAMAATLKFETGDCGGAIAHFELSRSQMTANEQASSLYAECLIKQGRSYDAIKILLPFAHGTHPSGSTWNLLAAAETASNHPEQAGVFYSKAIDAEPENEQNYIDFAALYIQHDVFDSALPIVESGLKHSPNSARLHAMRGVIMGQIGTEAEAVSEFELANWLDPNEDYGAPGLGVLYASSNETARASDVLRERLKKNPDDPTLNYLLAETLIRQDVQPGTEEFAEVSAALRHALSVKPDYGSAHVALGKLYNRTGDYSSAARELRVGLQLKPSDRTALSQLAIALRHLGREDEAVAVSATLKQVVMRDVQNGAAKYPMPNDAGAR